MCSIFWKATQDLYKQLFWAPHRPHLSQNTVIHHGGFWLYTQSESYFEWNCSPNWAHFGLIAFHVSETSAAVFGVCFEKPYAAVHVHPQSWCDKCMARSSLMDANAHASLSDWSRSDVRRCLHGGRCLAAHRSDHCQLPSVPPTQTLALWITLHEHAQRSEYGLWKCDSHPSSSIHSSIHPSVSQPAASISFPWLQGQKQ